MIKRWKKELNALGFHQLPDDRKAFVKEQGFSRQTIWEGHHRLEKNRALINLAVSLRDRFLEPPDYVTALVAYLRADEAIVIDDGEGRWWEESEADDALAALLKYGVPWLEEYSQPAPLIRRLEGIMSDGINEKRAEPGNWSARLAKRLLLRQQGVAGPSIRRPPVYAYYLSLAYDEVGDLSKACEAGQRWLAHVKTGRQPGEPERTLSQLAQMKCPAAE